MKHDCIVTLEIYGIKTGVWEGTQFNPSQQVDRYSTYISLNMREGCKRNWGVEVKLPAHEIVTVELQPVFEKEKYHLFQFLCKISYFFNLAYLNSFKSLLSPNKMVCEPYLILRLSNYCHW